MLHQRQTAREKAQDVARVINEMKVRRQEKLEANANALNAIKMKGGADFELPSPEKLKETYNLH